MRRVDTTAVLPGQDLVDVQDLVESAERSTGHPVIDDQRWRATTGGGDRATTGVVARDAGRVVGYAQVSRGQGDRAWVLDLVVHPDHGGELIDIATDLLGAAVGTVAAEGGGHVDLWVRQPAPAHDAAAAAVGLAPARDLYQLRRPLPVDRAVPDLVVRPLRPDDDHDVGSWLAVNNRAFHWHPDQGGWDRRTFEERRRQPWFDPEGFLLHEREGRLAGFCWTKVHAEVEPPLGEIYVIAVDPDFQGLGLGRDLVLVGLDHLARRGLRTGMLYVDAANTAAVALYESLGFTVARLDRAYGGKVAPAAPR